MTTTRAVRVICTVLGTLLLGAAVVVALAPLPAPAVGGTCGPSASSESAAFAFLNPVSIGAGSQPSASSGQRPQWQAFVSQCQTATNTRMTIAGGIVVGALVVALALPWAVKRFDRDDDHEMELQPPGWYPDPTNPSAGRWWDGREWGPSLVAPDSSPLVSATR